jgi:hypothetical protein
VLDAQTGFGYGWLTFAGGTGRFVNATGGGTFLALIDVRRPVNAGMGVSLQGSIAF